MLSFLGKRATPIQASCKLIFLFSFFSFFLSPPGCANTRDREYLCRRGRTRDGFVEGSGISLSLSFCWKVYSSPIESFTYIENFAAMYSYNSIQLYTTLIRSSIVRLLPDIFPPLSSFILENAHYSVVLIELRPRIFIPFLALCLQKNPMEQGKPIFHDSRRISRRTKLIPTQIRTTVVALVIRDKS